MLKRKQKKLNNEHPFVFGLFSTIHLTAKIRLFSARSSNKADLTWKGNVILGALCASVKPADLTENLRSFSDLSNNNSYVSHNLVLQNS